MAFSLDFLGFGSKRKTAFRLLDKEWAAMDVDTMAIDGGVRQLLYQWAQDQSATEEAIDSTLLDLAAFSGFLMLGPEVGLRAFGANGVAAMLARLDSALAYQPSTPEDDDPLDVRVIKLVMAAKLADRDILARVTLDQEVD